jgi:hypothetical protein
VLCEGSVRLGRRVYPNEHREKRESCDGVVKVNNNGPERSFSSPVYLSVRSAQTSGAVGCIHEHRL